MAGLKRKKTTTTVPTEVQDYYRTERRERVGMAWLLVIVTFIFTALLAVVLYFGGRWVYRAVFKTDTKQKTTTSQTEQQSNQTSQPNENKPENANGSNPSPAPDEGQVDSQAATTSQPSTASPQQTPQKTPDTGPGNVVVVFIGVSVVSALAHAVYTRRKSASDL